MAMELPTQTDLSNFLFFVHFSWKALIQEWYKGWCTSNNHVLLRKWYWDNIVCLSNLKLRFSIKFRALEPHNDNSNIKWCLLYIKISKVSKKFSLVYGYELGRWHNWTYCTYEAEMQHISNKTWFTYENKYLGISSH